MSASTFPASIDTFTKKVDITSSDIVNVKRYRDLREKTSLTVSEQAELSNLVVTLASKMMSTEDFNKLQDCIVALEVFVKNNVDVYFQNAQANALTQLDAEISKFAYRGTYNSSTQYYKMNLVKLDGDLYFCEQNSLNNPPSNTIYWTKIGEKGDRGEKGLGLSFRGSYNNSAAYSANDAVSYDDGNGYKIYYALQSTVGHLPTDGVYWGVFLDIGQFSALIGNMALLDTTAKDTIVNAINEVISEALQLGETSLTAYRGDRGKIAYDHSQSANHAPQNIEKFITASGTATDIILTTGYFNLINNQSITFIALANNNGATTTINVDGKGARNVYKPNTTTAPIFIAGKAYTVWYNTTNACFFIKASAEGTATKAQVLAGVPFSNEIDTGLIGEMTDNGTVNQSLAINGEYTIPEGYHSGLGKVIQNIPTKSAQTYTPSQSAQIINSGQYLTGNQTISAVSFDASKVLTGTTIAGKAGTMPNRAGDTASLAISRSGTTLKLRASNGYRDGVDDNVTYNEPNWVAANIPQGMSMFGLAGTNTNKKWASGTGTAYPNSTSSRRMLGITGLSFKPRIVIIWDSSVRNSTTVAAPNSLSDISNNSMIYKIFRNRSSGYSDMEYGTAADVSSVAGYINSGEWQSFRASDGFYLPAIVNDTNYTITGSEDYLWFACE